MEISLLDSRIIISISLILIGFIPNSFASSQNSTLDSQGNYANPSLGITFQAPAGWTVQEPKKSQPDAPDVAVIAPYSNGFTASISLIVENANGTSLDNYVKNKQTLLMSNNQSNIRFLSEENDTVAGLAAKTLLLEENFTAQNNTNAIKFKQTTVLSNDKFYTITYANDAKNFDADLTNYEQLLNSIKFVNNQTFPFDYLSVGIAAAAIAVGAIITVRRKKRSQKTSKSTQ